jgi:hypothetical protein
MNDYLSTLESVAISPVSLRGDVARTACPIHQGNNHSAFVFWTETGHYFCHSCGERGDIVDLVQKAKHLSEQEALAFLNLENRPKPEFEIHKRDKSNIDFTHENNIFLSSAGKDAENAFNELISPEAMKDMDTSLLKGLIGYDAINNTITVAIKSDGRVVQIKRRKLGDKKWVGMKGSDGAYCPHRLTGKNAVYIASGMAEYVLLHASGQDYIAMQSDSISLDEFYLSDKIAIIFEDNDKKPAPEGTAYHLLDPIDNTMANHFKLKVTQNIKAKKIIVIDFENVLDRNLPKGYDLRDFVNEYPNEWSEMINNEIEYWYKEELC